MILNLFRKHHYFAVYEVITSSGPDPLDKKKLDVIKRYFWWRGRRIQYFEPHITKGDKRTFLVYGTTEGVKKIKRNAMIFLLELFAELEDEKYKISETFPFITKTIGNSSIKIYHIKD